MLICCCDIYSVDLVIVQNYANAVDTVISEQQHDLRALVDFSTQTVQRQTKKFKLMRSHCFSNIELFQNESQRVGLANISTKNVFHASNN